MTYPVFYYPATSGDEMTLKSKVKRGRLTLGENGLEIEGGSALEISYREILHTVEVHRLHFLCSMLRITHRKGLLFVTLPLIQLFGIPMVTNYSRLRELGEQLDGKIRTAWNAVAC